MYLTIKSRFLRPYCKLQVTDHRNKNLVVQYRPQTQLASLRIQPFLLAPEIRRPPFSVADPHLQISGKRGGGGGGGVRGRSSRP